MKIIFFKKVEKHPKGFTLAISSVSNFRLNRPFMPCLGHLKGFRSIYGPGLGCQGPKIFKESKNHQGFTQALSLPNFRTDLTIYGFPRVLP